MLYKREVAGSNPAWTMMRPIRLLARTSDFQSGEEGSIPSWATKFFPLTGATFSSRLCAFFTTEYEDSVQRWRNGRRSGLLRVHI